MTTVSRILVATDFSDHAEAASRLAASVARAAGARLCLVHVDPIPDTMNPENAALIGDRPDLWHQYRLSTDRLVRESLTEAVRSLAPWTTGLTVDTVVEHGSVASGIERRARLWAADLIVMGSHGAGASERYLFGTALTELLPAAPFPVLVTRAAHRDRTSGELGFERPLIAVDYSSFAEPATVLARGLGAPGASLDLVHVWQPPLQFDSQGGPRLGAGDRHAFVAAAEEALTRERDRLVAFRRRVLGTAPARCEVGVGRVASVLLDHARQHACDLLVVGAHSGTAGSIGSVTDRILRHAAAPVLFVPDSSVVSRVVREPRRGPRMATVPGTGECQRHRVRAGAAR